MRILVVHRDTLSRQRLRALVEQKPNVLVTECANGVDAIRLIETNSTDLIIGEVSLAELRGFAVLASLKRFQRSPAAYVTAGDRHFPALEVHALDYLREPFTDERFDDALLQACQFVEQWLADDKTDNARRVYEKLVDERPQLDPRRDWLVVKDNEKGIFHLVQASEIDWIEAKDGGVMIHTGKETFASRYTLVAVQQRLDPNMFLRIHRSYLVNHTRIRTLKPLWKGEYVVTLICGKSLCTGRSYRVAVEALLE